MATLSARIAASRMKTRIGAAAGSWLARSFPRRAHRRILVGYTPNRISWSQIYPLFHYAEEIRAAIGAEIRAVPLERLGEARITAAADTILLQPWYTMIDGRLARVIEALDRRAPQARLSVLDPGAHADLRLARDLPDRLYRFGKKAVFRDHAHYHRLWRGDTNLSDYYGALGGLSAAPVDFRPPAGFEDKLALMPSFFTDPRFIHAFARPAPPPQTGRSLDIQTRLGRHGLDWYEVMRGRAIEAVDRLEGVRRSPDGAVPHGAYITEMAQSKLCFSPFGYGELCWRDIEAILTGAVLIKPDMSHLETRPELYEAGVTYLPIAWDYSDLEEVVRRALADAELRSGIAIEAWRRIAGYLEENRFVGDITALVGR